MASESWQFDLVHSSINFSVRHLVVSKVRGRFQKWSGQLAIDKDNPAASSVEVSIDTASVDTHDAGRDAHLRNSDFFEVEKYPHITFKSSRVVKVDDGEFKLYGDLTIKGVSRPVELLVEYSREIKDPWGDQRSGFAAHTSISRKDFGITFNMALETGGVAVGDKVDITIEVEVVKQVPAAVPAP